MLRLVKKAFIAILAHGLATQAATGQERVLVFAAASLKTAFDSIAVEWSKQQGGAAQISYASSGALARQIEQGAPADIFVSADTEWMGYLADRKLIRAETRRSYLANRLVLVTAADRPIELKLAPGVKLAAALDGGRLAVGEVNSVPAGKYARQALEYLGLWETVSGHLAQAENVRAALAFVARGEAPLGIVYATDAKAEPRVRVIDVFPRDSHAPIVYPLATTAASTSPAAAPFLTFLRGPPATRILQAEGFEVLE